MGQRNSTKGRMDERTYEQKMYYAICQHNMTLFRDLLKRCGKKEIDEWWCVSDNGRCREHFKAIAAAAGMGHLDFVKVLVEEKGADVNTVDKNKDTALHVVCKQGHLEIAKLLIRKYGADVNAFTSYKESPLIIASMYGHGDIVKLLCENGVNVNASGNYEWTALHHAVQQKRFDITKVLIENGADVNAVSEDDETPLYLAISHGSVSTAKLLIEYGADVNRSRLIFAACQGGYAEIVKLLIQNGAEITISNDASMLFHVSICNGIFDVVRILIEKGLDVNAAWENQRPLIVNALNQMDTVLLLFCIGRADITERMVEEYEKGGTLRTLKWIRQHDKSRRVFTPEERKFLFAFGFSLVKKFHGIGRKVFATVLPFMAYDGLFMSRMFSRGDMFKYMQHFGSQVYPW